MIADKKTKDTFSSASAPRVMAVNIEQRKKALKGINHVINWANERLRRRDGVAVGANTVPRDEEGVVVILDLHWRDDHDAIEINFQPITLNQHANRVRFPVGSFPDFRFWESCWTILLIGGFSRGSPVLPTLAFRRCSNSPRFTPIGSHDLSVKSRRNLTVPFLSATLVNKEVYFDAVTRRDNCRVGQDEILREGETLKLGCLEVPRAVRTASEDVPEQSSRRNCMHLNTNPFTCTRRARSEGSMEQRWNARADETGELRENPPTSGVIQHAAPLGIELGLPRLKASALTVEALRPPHNSRPHSWTNRCVGLDDRVITRPRQIETQQGWSLQRIPCVNATVPPRPPPPGGARTFPCPRPLERSCATQLRPPRTDIIDTCNRTRRLADSRSASKANTLDGCCVATHRPQRSWHAQMTPGGSRSLRLECNATRIDLPGDDGYQRLRADSGADWALRHAGPHEPQSCARGRKAVGSGWLGSRVSRVRGIRVTQHRLSTSSSPPCARRWIEVKSFLRQRAYTCHTRTGRRPNLSRDHGPAYTWRAAKDDSVSYRSETNRVSSLSVATHVLFFYLAFACAVDFVFSLVAHWLNCGKGPEIELLVRIIYKAVFRSIRSVHDKVSTFEIDLTEKSLPLYAYILTGELIVGPAAPKTIRYRLDHFPYIIDHPVVQEAEDREGDWWIGPPIVANPSPGVAGKPPRPSSEKIQVSAYPRPSFLGLARKMALIGGVLMPPERPHWLRTGQRLCHNSKQRLSPRPPSHNCLKAVHDKVATFEINFRKKSLPLPAYISTGALSGMRPGKVAYTYVNSEPGQWPRAHAFHNGLGRIAPANLTICGYHTPNSRTANLTICGYHTPNSRTANVLRKSSAQHGRPCPAYRQLSGDLAPSVVAKKTQHRIATKPDVKILA
ncbi:hypothetical protein PR048_010370 [Dryococelus australis]|uniref:Uncharacterized protein n=1 Tax=Dryococelus australis TaxID=614101 RepID=A0ABQ9I2J9_9NEOP|nr:hypothetical protein PR048_010370 [Dryococelus australis]